MSGSKQLFKIQNLTCSYRSQGGGAKEVLAIKALSIKKGNLIFVVGKSGSGKSTFLETLGLMTNTINEGTLSFFPEDVSSSIDYISLWKNARTRTIEEIRKKYFSFIFQKTKFPDGYSVLQSLSIPQLIQGVSASSAESLIHLYLKSINLNLTESTHPYELSGGMAQQAAYIRALSKDFWVLFGDEPTGNIDIGLSYQLMTLLKKSLHENNNTAIIVSHDIPLALEFADQLIIIKKNDPASGGVITEDLIYERISTDENEYSWKNLTNQKLSNHKLKNHIEQIITPPPEVYYSVAKMPDKLLKKPHPEPTRNLRSLFIATEKYKLCGQKGKNLWGWQTWLLGFMLFFTFLTIGFAVGSCNYLKEKTNNPYINYVDVSVPWERSDDLTIDSIFTTLENDSVRSEYYIQNITGHKVFSLNIQDQRGKETYEEFIGRTIAPNNSLLNEIFSQENIIIGTPFQQMDIGLTVAKELLAHLQYIDTNQSNTDINVPFLNILVKTDLVKHTYQYVAVPVRAVVKELPGLAKFVTTPYFYVQRYGARVKHNPFVSFDRKRLHLWTDADSLGFQILYESISHYLKTESKYKKRDPLLSYEINKSSYKPGFKMLLTFYPEVHDPLVWDTVFKDLEENFTAKGFLLHRYFHFPDLTSDNLLDKYDQLSIYFRKLNAVRAFEQFFHQEFKMEIDIAKIKEKENYNFVSKLTFFLGMAMVIISAAGICVFIATMLFNHLRKESENIGIHKAFGMSYSFLMSAYMRVTLHFLGKPLIISLILSAICGVGLTKIIATMTNLLEQGKTYFDIFSIWTLLAIFFIIIAVISSVSLTMKRILKSTPSDLIYARK